jgi:Holliday junction DNA helicase RuvA
MIFALKGTLIEKAPTRIIVDVGGVGYGVNIPLSTYEKLGDKGNTVQLLTRLHVKEDALELYGFASLEEKQLFDLLVLVSGIGPRLALGVLSGSKVDFVAQAIASGNTGMLTTISGVGKKLAERIVVELKDKVGALAATCETAGLAAAEHPHFDDAVLALVSLGLTKVSAQKALRHVASSAKSELPLEELIRRALSVASG